MRFLLPAVPGLAAALMLSESDILLKIVFADGCDVLTSLSFRSVVGLLFMAVWLRFGSKPPVDARVRWASIGVGAVFTVLIFCLFKAIEMIDVPTAVLTYFIYPLLTGIAAALTGLEPMRWRGFACAGAAFFGLALMIGAHPEGLAFAGVAFALGAACCRAGVLISTRAFLTGADARITTWYSLLAQTPVFIAASVITWTWNPPQTTPGWAALVGVSLATTAAIVFVFLSTVSIGPFRTALIMYLEPPLTMVLSALFLGQVIGPLQALGSAIMLAALLAFQLWR